ncbi:MAG TPA: zinc ribbon domain-containing protein [Phycisphaerae bacterium]|nr:zinc ribbon domain-containing protein [Phycisphaerales bacterium]HRX83652.1 zinc ribbon domain-containing protein [Phycisphaerae bacterium]
MPIYEYHCNGCGHEFEEMTSMARRDAKLACPACGAKQVERKFSVFAAGKAEAPAPSPQGGCGRCGGAGPCSAGNW